IELRHTSLLLQAARARAGRQCHVEARGTLAYGSAMSARHVIVVKDPEAVAHAAQRLFVAAAEKAIVAKGSFFVALSGGSTPAELYRLLAKGPPTEPKEWPFGWGLVHVFFVDE